jgi:hypothetical protein
MITSIIRIGQTRNAVLVFGVSFNGNDLEVIRSSLLWVGSQSRFEPEGE